MYNLDFISIDYLQLLNCPYSNGKSSNQIVSEISKSIREMAKELEVPVLALSQLNRALELRKDRRPMLYDLRDSGSLEQDAYAVLSLYREEQYTGQSKGLAEIGILKNRNGVTVPGISMMWDAERMKFKDKF